MDKFQECAYAAGLLDGEGSIGVYLRKNGKYRTAFLSVNVANTFLPALVWLRDRWGGYISPPRRAERSKPMFHWTLAANRAATFLRDVQPFVIIKRGQLENGLAFQATKRKGRPNKLTADEWARVEKFMETSRGLNKVGLP